MFARLANRTKKTRMKFPVDTKDINDYDMKRVLLKKMKPNDYLYLTKADQGINIFHKEDVSSLNNILYRIQNEKPIDAPFLEINLQKKRVENHDGRHRALGTMLSGIKELPIVEAGVVVNGKKETIIPVDEMTKEEIHTMNHPENLKPQSDENFDWKSN